MAECSVDGCANKAGVPGSARGLCRAHYRRWQRYGTEHEPLGRMQSWAGEICAEDGCEAAVQVHGLCSNHYAVKRRRNDPEGNRRRHAVWRAKLEAKQELAMGRPRPLFCELCQQEGYGRKPSIVFDHDHDTGLPRGWLCDRCNKTLGLVKDSSLLLRKMVSYLETHNGAAYDKASKGPADERIRRAESILSNRHSKPSKERAIESKPIRRQRSKGASSGKSTSQISFDWSEE